jgi:hypothetical protein
MNFRHRMCPRKTRPSRKPSTLQLADAGEMALILPHAIPALRMVGSPVASLNPSQNLRSDEFPVKMVGDLLAAR